MVQARLDDAVALSCDMDPEAIRLAPTVGEEYLIRIEQAVNHLMANSLPFVGSEQLIPTDNIVRLAVFAGWAEMTMKWELPEKFPGKKMAAPTDAARPETGGVTIRLPHMTKTLAAVFRVMQEHWGKFDSRGAPKQETVGADIDKALGWKPQADGSPSRSAQTLAAAIRRDEIAEADKRSRGR